MAFNWTCPHCGRDQSVVENRYRVLENRIVVGGTVEGDVSLCGLAIGCSNPDCNKLTLNVSVRPDFLRGYLGEKVDYDSPALYFRRIIPESFAKPQPEYIPVALREDYREACLIMNDSPKASATLARRCLQGMIRDFCKIAEGRLVDEISSLKKRVDEGIAPAGVTPETVEAIDHVRSIGNIGAHMEKDINLIVPVDPDEAQALIELIEMLFDEWYVARNSRQVRLGRISQIGHEKKQVIADGRRSKSTSEKPDKAP